MEFFSNVPQSLADIGSRGMALGVGEFRTGEVDVFTTYPTEWQELYAERSFVQKDPAVLSSLTHHGVHTWHANWSMDQEFVEACYGFNLMQGIAVTNHIAGSTCIAGLTTERDATTIELEEAQRQTRIAHIEYLKDRAASLSATQKDLVFLFSNGHRTKEVAALFGISDDAIKQRKLIIQRHIGVNNFLVVVNICAQAGLTIHPTN